MKLLLIYYENLPLIGVKIKDRETLWYGILLDQYAKEYDFERSKLTGRILDLIEL